MKATSLLARWKLNYRDLESALVGRHLFEMTFLAAILFVGVGLRVHMLRAPALDRTCWKEIDYLTISSNYWHNGYRFWRPEVTWPAEPPRVTAMELPLVPYVAALGYGLFGLNVYTARWITLAAFLVQIVYIYRLGRREFGVATGLIAASAGMLMPLSHEFGNILFSEPLMIALSIVAVYHYSEYRSIGRRSDWWVAMASFGLAVALKFEPLYLLLPLGYIEFRHNGFRLRRYLSFASFAGSALALPFCWYCYAFYLSRTSLDVFGVFPFVQGHDKLQTLTMLTRIDYYETMFGRLKAMLGGTAGLLFVLIGVGVIVWTRRGFVVLAYFAAILAYFAIVAEGNLDAPYRQLPVIPLFALTGALGAVAAAALASAFLPSYLSVARRPGAYLILTSLGLAAVLTVRVLPSALRRDPQDPADRAAWAFAQAIREHNRPGGRLIIAGEYSIHKGGVDLSPVTYYYSGAQGWTLTPDCWTIEQVETYRSRGADLFAAVDMGRQPEADGFLTAMRSRFPMVFESDRGFILRLTDVSDTSVVGRAP